ncbi:embryo-specific protein ATS3B-like [Cucurbita maxima]|uniref:Embryo-specific protein ATS3B-like n=1 Tax=Cucurbita maxima TaxID=3661 RepID=A0A6J1JAH7_CUCMA|nr:embryo-specific protein ATS3B-like [Cucurbita maxima]
MERSSSPPLLLLLLLSSLAVVCSAVEPPQITVKPDIAPQSLPINYIQEVGSCSYEVTVATSCSSPSFITDEIGVLFGDSHGNQIVEKKLSNGDKVFDSCNTDRFVLNDRPCSVQISYMYIYKDGADDWLPNSVEISGSGIKPLLFILKSSIPRNNWFGFDLRQYPFPSPPSYNPSPPFPSLSPPPPPPPPPPPHHPLPPPPEPILPPPPPPKPVLPPPPPPPSSSSKISGLKLAKVSVVLGLLFALL